MQFLYRRNLRSHIPSLRAHICIFMRAYLPEEEHGTPLVVRPFTPGELVVYLIRIARSRMTSESWNGVETTRNCNEGVKETQVGDEGAGRVGEKEAEKKAEKKRKRNNEYIFPLSTSRAIPCVSSLEQRPGNLIPFSIYLNPFTQTPLPTSSTFGLFLPFSACLPSAAVTSHPYSFFSMARFPSIRVRRAKGGTRFRHFLLPLRMLHRESSGGS